MKVGEGRDGAAASRGDDDLLSYLRKFKRDVEGGRMLINFRSSSLLGAAAQKGKVGGGMGNYGDREGSTRRGDQKGTS